MKKPLGTNQLLGRGKVLFDRFTTAGVKQGLRVLGNCIEFSLTESEERRQIYSSFEKSSPLLADALVRRTAEVRFVMTEYDPVTLALALAGDKGILTQSSGSVTNEAIADVLQGYHYQLVNRAISGVAVTGPGGTPTYTVGVDWEVADAAAGLIYIIPGGAITDLADIEVDYTKGAITAMDIVNAGLAGNIQGHLLFIGDPVNGKINELNCWRTNLAPDGAVGFIGDDFGNFALKGIMVDDSAVHPANPLFRLISR